MARPSKLTPEVQARVCEAVELGATRVLAAAAAGISSTTLHRWLADDDRRFREFREAISRAEAKGALCALQRVRDAADKGNWRAAAWLLERRHPEGYSQRKAVDMRAQIAGQLDHGVSFNPATMTDEQLRELISLGGASPSC